MELRGLLHLIAGGETFKMTYQASESGYWERSSARKSTEKSAPLAGKLGLTDQLLLNRELKGEISLPLALNGVTRPLGITKQTEKLLPEEEVVH